jgi:hypothetical protein
MRYEVSTGLTPREALELAITHFGPRGAGLHIISQTNLSLVFQGGGGHIAFMANVSRLPRWWARWWPRKKTAARPPSFQVLNNGDRH